ncbi:MAG TPA: hypothetical protein VNZ50_14290 [Hyphomicrobiaceae bacterium]|jgi:hypothetical protein|nr:hypothetical protein [Hyphomicrobiaceae bacterium]
MLARADDFLTKVSNDDAPLVRVVHARTAWSTMLGLVAAGAMTLPLFGGMFLLTSEAMSKPDAVSRALAQPLSTLQIVVGILTLSALLLIPARRMVAGVGRAGIVEIDGSVVKVAEKGFLSKRQFSEPLEAYRGVAHRIRTTVSGIQHELVLAHPDARRDVVIALDGTDPTMTPAAVIARLGLPEITGGEFARRR